MMGSRDNSRNRPVLRWFGGKWKMAPWILANMGHHETYTEAFGGAASVLLRKPRSVTEVYNDLDGEVVGLFRVLRDPAKAAELRRLVDLTPFARAEFETCLRREGLGDVERARRFVALSFMGYGADSCTRGNRTGFRSRRKFKGSGPEKDWANYPAVIEHVARRFKGVLVESRPGHEVLGMFDVAEALHYVDPPYLHSLRPSVARHQGNYRHEMTDQDHERLAGTLRGLKGMVIISGYASPLYDRLYRGWRTLEAGTRADGARPRSEKLWFNPRAWKARP